MLALIAAPSATTTFQNLSEWAAPVFADLLPIALIGVGIFVGLAILSYLVGMISGAFKK